MEPTPLIGRQEERKILTEARHSGDAEMVAVIGRRRVGKIFLIKTVYQKQQVFMPEHIPFIKKRAQREKVSKSIYSSTETIKSSIYLK